MGFWNSIQTSASGLTTERLRMDLIANNIANANTTRTPEGGPFQRQLALLMPRKGKDPKVGMGVRAVGIAKDQEPPRLVYDPGHPDANAEGYVAMPNVHVVTEMVDLITASRAYEANVTAMNAAKEMAAKALEIGRR